MTRGDVLLAVAILVVVALVVWLSWPAITVGAGLIRAGR